LGELSGREPRVLDQDLESPPYLCAGSGIHVIAGVGENAPERGGDAHVLGELEGLLEVGSDETPRIGADTGSNPPPMRQRPTVDSRQNTLHTPLFDRVVRGGVDIPKLKDAHWISSEIIASAMA
jgi:hypothetical protein